MCWGRVFDGMGITIDGGPNIIPKKRMDINGEPLNPAARDYPSEFIQTGISAIDGLNTLWSGGKTAGILGSPFHAQPMPRLLGRPRCWEAKSEFVVGICCYRYNVLRKPILFRISAGPTMIVRFPVYES